MLLVAFGRGRDVGVIGKETANPLMLRFRNVVKGFSDDLELLGDGGS